MCVYLIKFSGIGPTLVKFLNVLQNRISNVVLVAQMMCLYLLVISSAAALPHYSFTQQGSIILSHDTAHLALTLDLTPMQDLVQQIYNLSEKARMVARTQNSSVLDNVAKLLKSQYRSVVTELNELASFYGETEFNFRPLPSETTTEDSVRIKDNFIYRRKRFVGAMIAAIVAAVGAHSLFSSISDAKLESIKRSLANTVERQTHLVTLLDQNSQHISVNRRSIKALAGLVALLDQAQAKQRDVDQLLVASLYCNEMAREIRSMMSLFVKAIEAASSRRLAFGTLTYKGAIKALSDLRQLAAHRGLVPVPQTPQQLMQLECSFVPRDVGLALIVHVPLTKNEYVFKLHYYRPFPIPITANVNAFYVPPKDILALNNFSAQNGHQGQFLELSHSDLESCNRVGQVRICTNLNVAKTPLFPSCLLDLYFADHTSALKTCMAHLKPPQDLILPFGQNKYLSYSITPATYSIYCPGNQTLKSGYQLSIFQELAVPKDCQIHLPSFILYPNSQDHLSEPPRTFTWTKTAQSMFPSVTPQHLDEALQTLKNIQHLPPTEITHIQTSYLLNHPLSPHRWPSYLSFGGVVILLLAFTILLSAFCIAYRRNRQANPP